MGILLIYCTVYICDGKCCWQFFFLFFFSLVGPVCSCFFLHFNDISSLNHWFVVPSLSVYDFREHRGTVDGRPTVICD